MVNKYCGVWGGGGGRQNPTKDNDSPSVIKIVKYCGVGRGHWGVIKSYKDGAPSPCHQDS